MRIYVALTKNIFATKSGERPSEERTWVREIAVPEDEVDEFRPVEQHDTDHLEVVFKYGQNDVQPRVAPSVSVGDLIFLDLEDQIPFRVEPFGFERVPWFSLTRQERLMATFGKANLNEAKWFQFDHVEMELLEAVGPGSHDAEKRLAKWRRDCRTLG